MTISNPRANCQELGRLQSSGTGTVATIYQAVKQEVDLEEDVLAAGSPELRKLHQQRGAMRILENGLVEIRLSPHGAPRWNLVCPLNLRHSLIWQTHIMAHSGGNKTLARLQLTWYWPGMSADTRRLIRSCEICQSAKHGGTAGSVGTRRLYAGRPWQVVAVDLVGPMPETPRGNRWILVLTDHFTRWQDALAIADATAPTVASVLDKRVFCYLGLPERIHSDQGAQFQSQLMQELCQLWGVTKTSTTPYHPQSNGLVERNNRRLGDSLRALLLRRGQDEWDLLLPQIMRAFRGYSPYHHRRDSQPDDAGKRIETARSDPDSARWTSQHQTTQEFVQEVQKRLSQVHGILREEQCVIRQEDQEEPPLFSVGDQVWMVNKRRRKGENPKLQAKFIGPYDIIQAYLNHTYLIERQGQQSIQSESRLKLYKACGEAVGRAPATIEPTRRPNMKGAVRKTNDENYGADGMPVPQPPENPEGATPPAEPEAPPPGRAPLTPEDRALLESIVNSCTPECTHATTPIVPTREDVLPPTEPVEDIRPPEPVAPAPTTVAGPPEVTEEIYSRPRRNTRPPDRYQAGYASVIQAPPANREQITPGEIAPGWDITDIGSRQPRWNLPCESKPATPEHLKKELGDWPSLPLHRIQIWRRYQMNNDAVVQERYPGLAADQIRAVISNGRRCVIRSSPVTIQ